MAVDPLLQEGRIVLTQNSMTCVFVVASVATGTLARGADSARPSLLGVRWDFADGSLKGWRHKDNAQLTIADENGNRALRLQSAFKPFDFTWTTRNFKLRTTAGVVHVGFRVRGSGSGHHLHVHLGTPRPTGRGSLYYINAKQAVPLDFTGWRSVSLDLDCFATPRNGLRERDLAQVHFLQFMIHAKGKHPTVDVWIDDKPETVAVPR